MKFNTSVCQLSKMFLLLFIVFLTETDTSFSQKKIQSYKVDSLITALRSNIHLDSLIEDAKVLYDNVGLQEVNISRQAFVFAFLAKELIDAKEIKGDNPEVKFPLACRDTLVVVDFTKAGNKKRLAIVDTRSGKLLFNTLTSHGSGRGDSTNRIDKVPTYFSNTDSSLNSSLGFMVTAEASSPDNPCHRCKYSIDVPHACQLTLDGLERDINDKVRKRQIIIHTTGSKDFSDSSSRARLSITDKKYQVDTTNCWCYAKGKKKPTIAYASDKFFWDNSYIGRSNGCLVLPEEEHISIIRTITSRCLIFCYSNVINGNTNYFINSPLVKQIIARTKKNEIASIR